MNDRQPANDSPASPVPAPLNPCCGNCRFAVSVKNDFLKAECRWGPPTPCMVPVPTGRPGQMALQQMVTFPTLPKNWHCHRHERRMDG